MPELDRGDGFCRYLELQPDGKYLCAIYETRPEICRAAGRRREDLKKACEMLRGIISKKELQNAA